ncbi:MAG: hypothetical protein PHC51_08435 [bacterium]|nr:hypothetical protein [bacterium]
MFVSLWNYINSRGPRTWKRWLTVSCTFIAGAFFFLEYMLPETISFGPAKIRLSDQHENVANALILIGAMAVGLGIINLLRVHGLTVLRARKGWINSLALLAGLGVSLGIECGDFLLNERRSSLLESVAQLPDFLKIIRSDQESSSSKEAEKKIIALQNYLHGMELMTLENDNLLSLPEDTRGDKDKASAEAAWQNLRGSISRASLRNESLLKETSIDITKVNDELYTLLDADLLEIRANLYDLSEIHYRRSSWKRSSEFIFAAFFTPLGAAMFSLLAFYVATAAYRTFRIRSMEAGLMMLASVVVMLGQIPHGVMYISSDLPQLRLWLMENINAPAFRAIYFGSAIATLAMAIRMWLSLENSPLSEGEES